MPFAITLEDEEDSEEQMHVQLYNRIDTGPCETLEECDEEEDLDYD